MLSTTKTSLPIIINNWQNQLSNCKEMPHFCVLFIKVKANLVVDNYNTLSCYLGKYDCVFDQKNCGWKDISSSKRYKWKSKIGKSESRNNGPQFDHTTLGGNI